MDIVLIRHPAVAVPAGVCYGRSDVPLAGDAAEAAARVAAKLASLGAAAPAHVETSPRGRCRLVADALAASHGLAARADARLAEMDFGAWEGCKWDDIGRAALDAWAADLLHAREHGGESVAQMAARVGGWFDEFAPDAAAPGMRWVVAHAGAIRMAAAHALRVPVADAAAWPLDYDGVVWLRFRAASAQWVLARWNA